MSLFRIFLASFACGSAAICAESINSKVNLDIWYVRDLYGELASEDYAVRERATRALIAIGPAVLPELELAAADLGQDTERRARIERIRREATFGHLTTPAEIGAERQRLLDVLTTLSPQTDYERVGELQKQLELLLGRLEQLVPAREYSVYAGEFLLQSGRRYYELPPRENSSFWLSAALSDLGESIACFESALEVRYERTLAEKLSVAEKLKGEAGWARSARFGR